MLYSSIILYIYTNNLILLLIYTSCAILYSIVIHRSLIIDYSNYWCALTIFTVLCNHDKFIYIMIQFFGINIYFHGHGCTVYTHIYIV